MSLRIAVMGTGRIAGKVAPFIQAAQGCDVVAAASRDEGRARAFAYAHALPGACTYDQLVTHRGVDAVYITLPNGGHPGWTERLLRAGKHVLCEKPLCWTRAQADRLFTTASGSGCVLAEAFMYIHSPLIAEAAAIARSAIADPGASPIGALRSIEARFDISIDDGHTLDPNQNVRYSRALMGGALMDLGCYPLSFARTVTGEMPETLEASATMVDLFAGSPRDGANAVDGAAEVKGRFPSGVAFDLSCSMIEPPREEGGRGPEVVARLIGDRGGAEIRDFPRPERIVIRSEGGERVIGSPEDGGASVYTLQAESFARAVASGEEPTPSAVWSIEQATLIEQVLGEIGLVYSEPEW